MDSQICHTFLKYDPNHDHQINKLREPKNLDKIKSVHSKEAQIQFEILCSAQISQEIYNQKFPKMNRYTDIQTYEHSRVKVSQIPNYYINANEVKSLVDGKVFTIFSQAPIKAYDNFWEAVYYKNVSVVVMLCSFFDPKRGHQSEQYWPNHTKHANFSNGTLKVANIQCLDNDKEYITSIFEIEGPQGKKTLTHIHWMGWSDLKKPAESNMGRFEQILLTCLNHIQNNKLIWIHCSAGIGRTGTLGGVIEAVRLYKKQNKISIFAIVENLRKYRYHAVQTWEQYKFLYNYLGKKLA